MNPPSSTSAASASMIGAPKCAICSTHFSAVSFRPCFGRAAGLSLDHPLISVSVSRASCPEDIASRSRRHC